jgi:signal peptidase I
MNNRQSNQSIVKNIGLTLLSEGKTIRIKAHGYSMYPSIKPGSLILIEPLKINGLPRPGEIIAIKRESGLVVHRLIKIINKNGVTSYIARGDSNAYADNPVKIEKIAGRIVRAESTGDNPVPADIRINTKPNYIINRIRVIVILLTKKIQLTAKSAKL